MKSIFLIVSAVLIFWNANSPDKAIQATLFLLTDCDPPFLVMGLFDPSQSNDPLPAIFSEEVKAELMSDGFQGKDKEYGDVNGDGLVDILYTTNENELWFIPNSGSVGEPVFLVDSRINTGIIGAFSFRLIDWYADGITDLVVLEKFSGDPANITLYIDIQAQIGFPSPAATLIDGAQVPINETQFMEMGDIDGDMFPDILISGQGSINGTAFYKFDGNGWAFPPAFTLVDPQTLLLPMIPENGGSVPCPELFDADCDGDLDLFISDPLWLNGGGHVDYYENTGEGSPLLYFTPVSPNPFGLTDLVNPDMSLSCDAVVTRFVDFFDDGFAEAIAYNPCHSNHPNGDMFYYRNPPVCIANFSFELNGPCHDLVFIDQSIAGVPVTYFWDFGDPASGANNTSTQQTPSHIFTSCGAFNVCLTINGTNCSNTFCQVIQITDLIPPTAKCLSGVGITLDANCIAVATPSMIDDGSFDDCKLQSLTLSPDTFTQCGVFPVVLTATDLCGNTSTCSSEVQVIEDTPPVIICPSDREVIVELSPCDTVVNGIQWIQLSDNCSTPMVTYDVSGASTYFGVGDASGLLFSQGLSTVTYTAIDDCGNTSQCSFSVNVKCSCNCGGNLVQNQGFYKGSKGGDLDIVGKSDHWLRSWGSPQVVLNDPCCDSVSIQMYGQGMGGEAIKQEVPIQAGHQYQISFCARYYPTPYTSGVRFNVTSINNYNGNAAYCTSCQKIGDSPNISNQLWATYTLPIWTAVTNWKFLNIRAWSIDGNTSWGRIDNICVREVFYSCCDDEEAFVANARNAINVYADPSGEEAIFEVGNLPECDSIAYIDWGDGEIETGPFGGNFVRRHRLLDHLLARIEYQVNEYPDEIPVAQPCFEHVFVDSLEVGGPDTCVCLGFTGLYIRSMTGDNEVWIENNGMPVILSCPEPGSGYNFTGAFQCAGSSCMGATEIQWTLTGPAGTTTDTARANPHFGIPLLPSYFSVPGVYSLTIIGQCGDNFCESITEFVIDCDDLCPCASEDIQQFQEAVERGFARVFQPEYGCDVSFSPVALDDCETVEWYLETGNVTLIGNSTGNNSFNYTFSGSGTYSIIMVVTRTKSDGSLCETFSNSQNVTVSCLSSNDCDDSLIDNSEFAEGAMSGGLNSGGASEGWGAVSGDPIVIEGEQGSADAWSIQLAGNLDTVAALTRYAAICLDKGIGRFSTTVKSSKSNSSERRFGGTLKVLLSRGWSFPPVFNLGECDDLSCYVLASIPLPESDSAEWYDIEIPFDLSQWDVIDDCGGIVVRPIVYVTNVLGNDQGGEATYSYAQLDRLCFNGMLVSVEDPAFEKDFRIYPNPNHGYISVEFSEPANQNMTMQIVSLTGQLLLEKKADVGNVMQTIEATDLPQGMYFLQVIDDGRIQSFSKFVKL